MFWRVEWDFYNWNSLYDTGELILPMEIYDPFFYDKNNPTLFRADLMSFAFDMDDPAPIPDFPHSGHSAFVCRKETTISFGQMFQTFCKSCEVPVGDEIFDMHIVKQELDGFDLERSEYEPAIPEEQINLTNITKLVLKPEFTSQADIFRLSGSPACRLEVIVSDRFKKIYDDKGFTGLNLVAAQE